MYTKPKTGSSTNQYVTKPGKTGSLSPTKGYTPTPVVNPVDVAYQIAYERYEDKRISEFEKISDPLKEKYDAESKRSKLDQQYHLKQLSKYLVGPVPEDPEEAQFLLNLYKDAKQHFKNAKIKRNNGDYVGSTQELLMGTMKIQLFSVYVTSEVSIVNALVPK